MHRPALRRFEAGTPPIAQAVGLGVALEWLMAMPSGAIKAHEMHLTGGLLDAFDLMATSRASLSIFNTDAEIDAMVVGLKEAIATLRL